MMVVINMVIVMKKLKMNMMVPKEKMIMNIVMVM
jgi:hypothetical protein